MPGVDAPAASRANRKQHTSRVTTVTPVHPAFPARWFYGFLRALLGDRAFLSPSSARCEASSPNASVEASGPHDFAVRSQAPFVIEAPKRPSHPASRP